MGPKICKKKSIAESRELKTVERSPCTNVKQEIKEMPTRMKNRKNKKNGR
jgi:hypothetical protein